jgi:hypothetical protein
MGEAADSSGSERWTDRPGMHYAADIQARIPFTTYMIQSPCLPDHTVAFCRNKPVSDKEDRTNNCDFTIIL